MTSQDPDDLPAECRLLADRRRELLLSRREAARRAGMPEATARQLEQGRHHTRPPWTVARYAEALQVTPEELEAAARPDAARDLRTLMRRRVDAAPGIPRELRAAAAGTGGDGLLVEMALGLSEIDASPHLTNPQKKELTEEFLTGIARDISERRANVRAVLRVAQGGDVG
ncbi:MAG: helix-turn-helix domain-containing protein [Streptosporangiaceae bacterium]